MADKESQTAKDKMAQLTLVTMCDFEAVDFEAPIQDSKSIECAVLRSLFSNAAGKQMEAGNDVAARVFKLLADVASINLKPWDRSEPFGPIFVSGDGRLMIPSDLKGEQSRILSEIAPDVKNLGLRARLSDIAWQNDQNKADMAKLAIHSYCEAVQFVVNGQGEFFTGERNTGIRGVCSLLRRACLVANVTGWKDTERTKLKLVIQETLQQAFGNQDYEGFMDIGILGLDWHIHSAVSIAEKAETLALVEGIYLQVKRELWELAARGYHQSDQESDNYRCLKCAAECFVEMAADAGGKGLEAANYISHAIEAYRKIPGTHERREELQKLLRKAQSAARDEMQVISKSVGLTSFVEEAQSLVAGVNLSKALENFAKLIISPDPDALRAEITKIARENPLWSDMPYKKLDNANRVVAKSPGLSGGDENRDEAIRHLIANNETLRRNCAVHGRIEPARRIIHSEPSLDRRYFLRIAKMSRLVPSDRADVFALGFTRFFQGDFISAVHLLVPQLENSVRHVLSEGGEETSRILNDMTQESRSLPSMLDNCRETLEGIFSPAMVFDMDNVFVFKGGPKIRHSVAHGLISGAECSSADAIYACWFIYRLCCLPLLQDWAKVAESLDEIAT